MYAAQNVDINTQDGIRPAVLMRVLSCKLRRAPPAAADRQCGRQPVVLFPLGGSHGEEDGPTARHRRRLELS